MLLWGSNVEAGAAMRSGRWPCPPWLRWPMPAGWQPPARQPGRSSAPADMAGLTPPHPPPPVSPSNGPDHAPAPLHLSPAAGRGPGPVAGHGRRPARACGARRLAAAQPPAAAHQPAARGVATHHAGADRRPARRTGLYRRATPACTDAVSLQPVPQADAGECHATPAGGRTAPAGRR